MIRRHVWQVDEDAVQTLGPAVLIVFCGAGLQRSLARFGPLLVLGL